MSGFEERVGEAVEEIPGISALLVFGSRARRGSTGTLSARGCSKGEEMVDQHVLTNRLRALLRSDPLPY